VRYLLDPVLGEQYPFSLFLAAVFLSVWQGGRVAGFVALGLGAVVADYLFILPKWALGIDTVVHQIGLTVYIVVGSGSIVLIERLRQARFSSEEQTRKLSDEVLGHRRTQESLRQAMTNLEGQAAALSSANSQLQQAILTRQAVEARNRRLAAIVESSGDAILGQALDRSVTDWNGAAERLFGYTAAEITGRSTLLLVPPEQVEDAETIFSQVLNGRRVEHHETIRLRRDGTRVEVALSVSPIRGEDGRVVGVAKIARDVTAQKRLEHQLRESEALFRAAFEQTGIATALTTPDARFVRANAAFRRLFGYTEGELPALSLCEITHPHDRSPGRARREQLLAGDVEILQAEQRYVHKAGHEICGLTSESLIRDPNGQPLFWVVQVEDVTHRRLAGQRLMFLKALLDHATDFVEVIDPESGRFLGVNAASCTAHGYTRDEFLALTVPDIDPLVVGRPWPQLIAERRSGVSVFESLHRRRDGTLFPVEVSLRFIRLDRECLLAVVRDITERKKAEEMLRLRERAIQAVSQGIVITDAARPDHPIVYVSPAFEQVTGYTAAEVVGRNCRFLQGRDTDPACVSRLGEAVARREACTVELLNYRKDGTPFWNEVAVAPVRDDGGNLTHFVGVQTDVTHRRALEDQLRQGQKMEAIGRLAGGVAHDFNNLMFVVGGYAKLLVAEPALDAESRDSAEEILQAARRGTELTKKLLSFSRQTILEPRLLDPNVMLRDAGKMLARVLGEDVRLTTDLCPNAGTVLVDESGLEQAVMNLCLNARDAMPEGGELTIRTRPIISHPPSLPKPRDFVAISVSDTGQGIDEATRSRLFEPFFTTKDVGKGTGLGLASVYGFVVQSGGFIDVVSEPGRGTTFQICLPRLDEEAATKPEALEQAPPAGSDTVLLVEDESSVRALASQMLQECGYTVIVAADGPSAVQAAKNCEKEIALLMTDVVMPGGMGGHQTDLAVLALRPRTKVLYMSGYTADMLIRHGVRDGEMALLRKPFTKLELARKVREVLEGVCTE
jgi:PAS domain S-box-containing protein